MVNHINFHMCISSIFYNVNVNSPNKNYKFIKTWKRRSGYLNTKYSDSTFFMRSAILFDHTQNKWETV